MWIWFIMVTGYSLVSLQVCYINSGIISILRYIVIILLLILEYVTFFQHGGYEMDIGIYIFIILIYSCNTQITPIYIYRTKITRMYTNINY